jgi:DUF1680 family protein
MVENGYALLNRTWKKGDVIIMDLPMETQRVTANANLVDDIGKLAIQRGPIIYCAEWVDNNGKAANIIVPSSTRFTSEFKPDLLKGVIVLKAEVPAIVIENENNISTVKHNLTAIPYYSWANRGQGEMMVWFPTAIKGIELLAK